MNLTSIFDKFSKKVTKITGNHWAFIVACLSVIFWGACGPVFHYSVGWQMIINTGTTIITFLMTFVIMQAGNKDTKAIQLKLDEIIRAIDKADNAKMGIEEKTAKEIEKIKSK